jgi:hypothetical protein
MHIEPRSGTPGVITVTKTIAARARNMADGELNSVRIVEAFWTTFLIARNPEAIEHFVVDEFVIRTQGEQVITKDELKAGVCLALSKLDDFTFEVLETFQNEDGSRVVSRWHIRGTYSPMDGTHPWRRSLDLTGTSVWAVREDGRLLHNWVDRSTWNVFRRILSYPGFQRHALNSAKVAAW